MKILNDVIDSLVERDAKVSEVHVCAHWTAVLSKNCGLASTFKEEGHPHKGVRDVGDLTEKNAFELALYSRSENLLEASIGMATINSLIDIDESRCVEANAYEILLEKGRGNNVAIVGHFPFLPKVREHAEELWVIEKNPWEGDLPEAEAKNLIPRADVVGITGSAFTNHSIGPLLELCEPRAYVVVLGGSTPLSPVLFDYGVDAISGTKVINNKIALQCVSQGANFRQIKGTKRLTMMR